MPGSGGQQRWPTKGESNRKTERQTTRAAQLLHAQVPRKEWPDSCQLACDCPTTLTAEGVSDLHSRPWALIGEHYGCHGAAQAEHPRDGRRQLPSSS